MKIFIFRHCLLIAGLAKTTAHRVLFMVSMDSQRSKKFDGSHFWALGCLQTASGWLESIRAIMAPPPLSNVIPEPAQNRVNKGSIKNCMGDARAHSVNLGIKIHKDLSRCIMNSKGCVTQ